jgi:amino acid transporter
MTRKRILLMGLLIVPVSMYLVSIAISGVVNFRTLENLGFPDFDSDSLVFRIEKNNSFEFLFFLLSNYLPCHEFSP